MIEKLMQPITNKVDAFEFACRFGIRPSNKKAQERVYETLSKINQRHTLTGENIHILLAKKFNLKTDY